MPKNHYIDDELNFTSGVSLDTKQLAASLEQALLSGDATATGTTELKNTFTGSVESFAPATVQALEVANKTAQNIGRRVFGNQFDKLTDAQKRVIEITSRIWGSEENYKEYGRAALGVNASTESRIPAYATGGTYLVPSQEALSEGIEAYDARNLTASRVATTIVNVGAVIQDDFAEAFFPTIVLAPNEGNVQFSIENTYVMTDYLHTGDGSTGVPTGFGAVSIIDALVDPSILRDSSIDVVPIYSRSSPIFSNEVAPFTFKDTGIETGALVFGKNIDLLAASHDNVLNPTQIMDSTDQLDHDVRVDSIFLKIDDSTNPAEIIQIHLNGAAGTNFSAMAAKSFARELSLAYSTEAIALHGDMRAVDGTESKTLAFLKQPQYKDHVINLDISISGGVNLETSNIRVNSAGVSIASIWDMPRDGKNHDSHKQVTDTVKVNEIVQKFTSLELVGYTVRATRTNLNRRTRGILARTDIFTEQYTIPLGPPISVLSPVVDVETTNDFDAPIKLNRIRNSQNAVRTLLDFGQMLRDNKTSTNMRAPQAEIRVIARHVMRPYTETISLDMVNSVDSLRSADRYEDAVATIVAVIRHAVFKAWTVAGFGAAWTAMGKTESKPKVIIGTDMEIASYLTSMKVDSVMGGMFDVEVVSTINKEMAGKIVIGFSSNAGDPIFTHGNFYYMPELVSTLPKTTNGGQSVQMTVQNRNMHMVNIPIQLVIEVEGLAEVLTKKIAFNTKAI